MCCFSMACHASDESPLVFTDILLCGLLAHLFCKVFLQGKVVQRHAPDTSLVCKVLQLEL